MKTFERAALGALIAGTLLGLGGAAGFGQEEAKPPKAAAYDPAGRRDPFKNLLGGKELSGRRIITGLSDLSVDEVIIIGLVKFKGRMEAIVGLADGFPLTAREGDLLADGSVLAIRDGEVVLRKTKERGIPLLKPKDIVKEITPQER